jgi:hypothetical protein
MSILIPNHPPPAKHTSTTLDNRTVDPEEVLILQNTVSNTLVANKQLTLNLKHWKNTNSTLQQKVSQQRNRKRPKPHAPVLPYKTHLLRNHLQP